MWHISGLWLVLNMPVTCISLMALTHKCNFLSQLWFTNMKKSSSSILDYKRWTQSWSRFLGSQHACDISHKPRGRLPLLFTITAITFPAKEIISLGWYQIMLLGDRGIQTYRVSSLPRPLCNGAQPALESMTCKSQVRCLTNSATPSPDVHTQKYQNVIICSSSPPSFSLDDIA